MQADDAQDLFARAQAGDRAAFDGLVGRTEERLRAVVERRIGGSLRHEVDAADVVQETFLRAFRSLSTIEWQGEEAFLRWLARIAEHVVLDAARRHKKLRFIALEDMESGAEPAGSGPSPSTAVQREERFERLEQALSALPADHRTVIRLVRLDGLPLHEVARRMDRSVNAVSHLLHRALRGLRSAFGDTDSFHLPARRLDERGGDGGS